MKIRRYFTRFFARRSHHGQATFWADVVASGPGLNIRAVKQSDLDSVLPMMEKLSELHQNWDSVKYGFVEDVTSLYRNWLSECARNSRIVSLVTTINERVIAFVIGTVDQNPRVYRVPQYGFIRDLWVEEDYRKKVQADICYYLPCRDLPKWELQTDSPRDCGP